MPDLRAYLFCLSFYRLYFFLPPFKDNGLFFCVPDVLYQHSEVVLWNSLSADKCPLGSETRPWADKTWRDAAQGISQQFPLEYLSYHMQWHYEDKSPLVFKKLQMPEAGRRKQQRAWEFINLPTICSSVCPYIYWHITSLSLQFNHVRSQHTQIVTMCSVVRSTVKYTWSLPSGNSLLQEWWETGTPYSHIPLTMQTCILSQRLHMQPQDPSKQSSGKHLSVVVAERQNRIGSYTYFRRGKGGN